MSIPPEEDCILFDMHCKMGIKKTYKLEVEESEPLQAVYSKESCPNRMQIQPQMLNLCLANFPVCHSDVTVDHVQGNLDEISLVLDHDKVVVKSYIDNEKTEQSLMKKMLLTEMTLNPNDFDSYDFNTNKKVQLTFCQKELKAILGFCEKQQQPLSFFMDVEGKPLLMSVSMTNTFEADFVLATLIDPAGGEESQGGSQSSARAYTGTLFQFYTALQVSFGYRNRNVSFSLHKL